MDVLSRNNVCNKDKFWSVKEDIINMFSANEMYLGFIYDVAHQAIVIAWDDESLWPVFKT
ncbi:hypothetical protein AYK25_01745 [Thermoplasmatales archaeon SM1-50]|nr:MAG: hypothetical protein AYK25_01745 [Thermoplasmatales archaeon SM1-50]